MRRIAMQADPNQKSRTGFLEPDVEEEEKW